MPRYQPDLWQEGDKVQKGGEHGSIVILKNRQTGDPFPIVWIQDGPRKGQREYPNRGWQLALDWPNAEGQPIRCYECERPFKRPLLSNEIFCYACSQRLQLEDKAIGQTAGKTAGKTAGEAQRRWREQHGWPKDGTR